MDGAENSRRVGASVGVEASITLEPLKTRGDAASEVVLVLDHVTGALETCWLERAENN